MFCSWAAKYIPRTAPVCLPKQQGSRKAPFLTARKEALLMAGATLRLGCCGAGGHAAPHAPWQQDWVLFQGLGVCSVAGGSRCSEGDATQFQPYLQAKVNQKRPSYQTRRVRGSCGRSPWSSSKLFTVTSPIATFVSGPCALYAVPISPGRVELPVEYFLRCLHDPSNQHARSSPSLVSQASEPS